MRDVNAALPLCVLGGGLVGARHAQAAMARQDVALTAVVEPDQQRRSLLADRGLPVVADIDAVPGHTRAAIVATPTPLHLPNTLACFARDWAIIVEKPIAGSLADARAIVQAAGDRPVFVGHHRRMHPFVTRARDQLATLGDPVAVQALWSLRKDTPYFDAAWRRAPGGGPIMINLIHEIDLLQVLMGPIDEVSALTSSARRGHAVEDTAALSIRFENGALGSVLLSDAGASPWSFEAATGENPHIATSGADYLRLVATRGAVALPSGAVWRGANSLAPTWNDSLTRDPAPAALCADPLDAQLARFVAHLDGRNPNPGLCTGAEGTSALEMTLACAYAGTIGQPVRRGAVPPDYAGAGWPSRDVQGDAT